MRFFAALVAIGALSQTAVAQTPDCKSMPDPTARLACYDRVAPSAAVAGQSATARTSIAPRPSAAPADPKEYVDVISQEDALMNARLRNICRGC
jgi:hypothetical protein